MHHRRGIAVRVLPNSDRDAAEVLARPAPRVHPHTHEQRDPVGGAHDPERPLELVLPFGEHLPGPRPSSARPVPGSPHDDAVGESQLDRGARQRNRRRPGAAAVILCAEPLEIGHAEDTRHLHLGGRLPHVPADPVDLGNGQSGVLQSAEDRERAGVPLGHADVARVRQRVDAGDDRLPCLVSLHASVRAIDSASSSARPKRVASTIARFRYRCASTSQV